MTLPMQVSCIQWSVGLNRSSCLEQQPLQLQLPVEWCLEVVHIAFNQAGDILYAWVMGPMLAYLLSWMMPSIGDNGVPALASAAAYLCVSVNLPWTGHRLRRIKPCGIG
jgi:hypothetical protein